MPNVANQIEQILNDFGNSVKDQASWMALGGGYELWYGLSGAHDSTCVCR